ncbi:MAG: hypothetical protein HC899_17245 [Leptolyngbyaceae cyanobacterium SM1_4_3]|nr:hypothetical protein [Leptolyngbyaceae cyanobacterium SM1_4_3]NJN91597.1 hypothetical protein [Leptolyngbyaceae cyanobacterium SL_5_14]
MRFFFVEGNNYGVLYQALEDVSMMNVLDRPNVKEKLIKTVEPLDVEPLDEAVESIDETVESIDVKKLLPFDWRKLMILGVSLNDAKRIATNLIVREIVPVYWRKLIELGVPINEAHDIAEAIARYDAAQKRPNREQKELIKRYCATICRAELWRSKLLLA